MNKIFSLFILSAFAIFSFSSCEKEEEPIRYSEIELEILQQINQYRLFNGLTALTMHPSIYEEATNHNNYMIGENALSHTHSTQRFERLQNELNITAYGENIAQGYKTATSVVNAWLNSTEHKANIDADYTLTGISARGNEKGEYYFTQIFVK